MEDVPHCKHLLREALNGLHYVVRGGISWRIIPDDLPPWHTVYQQMQRWLKAEVFEAMVHDLCQLLRLAQGRQPQPSAAIFDSRTLQSSPESGERAAYDGAKWRKGRKTRMAVDNLGYFLALHVTAADEQDHAQVAHLAQQILSVTGEAVQVAFVDQGYTSSDAEQQALEYGFRSEVVKLPEAKSSFVLLPRRWVVERSFG